MAPNQSESAPSTRGWPVRHPILVGTLAVLGAVGVLVGVVVVTPLLDPSLASRPDPASTYEDGMARADELTAADGPEVNPVCRSRVLDQGERSEIAVVLLHGYTNCPQQWDGIAQAYLDAGYSVVGC